MSSGRCNKIILSYFTELIMRHMASVVKGDIGPVNKEMKKRPLSCAEGPASCSTMHSTIQCLGCEGHLSGKSEYVSEQSKKEVI